MEENRLHAISNGSYGSMYTAENEGIVIDFTIAILDL